MINCGKGRTHIRNVGIQVEFWCLTQPFEYSLALSSALRVPVCAAMAPKAKKFHPVTFGRSLTISGGHTPSKEFVLQTQEFEFTCVDGAADGAHVRKECVQISHKTSWLCEIATGQALFQRPLARVNIVNENEAARRSSLRESRYRQ